MLVCFALPCPSVGNLSISTELSRKPEYGVFWDNKVEIPQGVSFMRAYQLASLRPCIKALGKASMSNFRINNQGEHTPSPAAKSSPQPSGTDHSSHTSLVFRSSLHPAHHRLPEQGALVELGGVLRELRRVRPPAAGDGGRGETGGRRRADAGALTGALALLATLAAVRTGNDRPVHAASFSKRPHRPATKIVLFSSHTTRARASIVYDSLPRCISLELALNSYIYLIERNVGAFESIEHEEI